MIKLLIPILLLSNLTIGQTKSETKYFKDDSAFKRVKKGPYKMVISQVNDSVTRHLFSKTRSGQRIWEKYFLRNQPYGTWTKYDKKGKVLSKADYNFILKYGKLVPEHAYSLKELGISPENDPNLPIISAHLKKHFKYPQSAIENGYEGTVLMQFTINEFGKVGNIRILKSVAMSLDIICYRIVKAIEKVKPYELNKKQIMVYYTLPIKFKLVEK